MKKHCYNLFFCTLLFTTNTIAGGWSDWSVPSQIETIRSQGMLIHGSFGNPSGCTQGSRLWILKTHPQYDQLYSKVLAAFMAGKKIAAYSHQCAEIGWHGGTFNEVTDAGTLNIKN